MLRQSTSNIIAEFNQWVTRLPPDHSVAIPAASWQPVITPAPKQEGQWYQTSNTTCAYRGAVWDLSTLYRVEFPATTTKSFFAGSLLEKTVVYEFSTATPHPKLFFPQQGARGVPTNVVFIMCFDQQINPSKLVQKVKISEAGLLKKAGTKSLLLYGVSQPLCPISRINISCRWCRAGYLRARPLLLQQSDIRVHSGMKW